MENDLLGCILYVHMIVRLFSSISTAATVILTTSIEDQGRVAACPREEVVFTCRITDSPSLSWLFSSQFQISFVPSDPQNMTVVVEDVTATLTEVIVNPNNIILYLPTSPPLWLLLLQ